MYTPEALDELPKDQLNKMLGAVLNEFATCIAAHECVSNYLFNRYVAKFRALGAQFAFNHPKYQKLCDALEAIQTQQATKPEDL